MKSKRIGHPTREIVKLARTSPGGIIRWHEARDVYLEQSESARRDEQAARKNRVSLSLARARRRNSVSGSRHYHLSLQRVLKRNFVKVQGTDGFWVLKHSVCGDQDGDVLDNNLQI